MEYIALGCMSGTSLDGIDCSLIKSDGLSFANEISNEFFTDNYLRINSPLGKINRFLDDDSEENLEKIHLMGMDWWSEFGEETLRFIDS